MDRRRGRIGGFAFLIMILAASTATAAPDDARIETWSRAVVLADISSTAQGDVGVALAGLKRYGKADAAAALILALRFNRPAAGAISDTLAAITGETRAKTWRDWMVWQEAHPEIVPHPSFAKLKVELIRAIDPDYARFLPLSADARVRLEEVVWGGVAAADGIPALTNPRLIAAADAGYLIPGEPVFGVDINGDARAYPLRIMDWHEMLNDVIGGMPVALAYCTLCGSGILYDARVDGLGKPLVFGSSGLLYRSNKLMFDTATDSLWNQFTGKPVSGPLAASDIALRMLPVVIASWRDWKARHPDTKVLSLDTGYLRDYTPDAAYGHYFNSPDLMFPARADGETHALKDPVFGLRTAGGAKAWPIDAFRETPVVNDTVGLSDVVLIGNALTRAVRAYRRDGRTFAPGPTPATVVAGGQDWTVAEDALIGPAGERLPRMAGHVAFWFAWSAFVDGPPE